ncbi:PREDICTED: integrin beta-1-binding protein 2 [Gavialis gangeticus]|uniref:integrin beta-1-binding protein 2 n=1 Tax=Gavialis gangeticus TaxID=94835 RepID=UPI00092F8BDB|nr:PREDICTED: integrin beta-1-binding protein 2 [Gavialis gangeticus]
MALLCYNKGCGQRFDLDKNSQGSCVYHPGVPIFHDALKGWSCCKKRTTDFSEFLSIKGCTKGCHSSEKPSEPFSQVETSDKLVAKLGRELIVQGPKSAEKMQRERPSSDELRQQLPIKVSRSLEQVLEKLNLTSEDQPPKGGSLCQGEKVELLFMLHFFCSSDELRQQLPIKVSRSLEQVLEKLNLTSEDQPPKGGSLCQAEAVPEVRTEAPCQNPGCKVVYRGPESDKEACTFHPGVPVFHEGMKYWSCCGIKTTDFSAFLEQRGCSTGTHAWTNKQDKKLVSCRQDWHQTSSQVVVTVYAKNPLPALSFVKANRTVLEVRITFEGNRVFQAELDLWGVIEVEKSFVNMVPTKVEITLSKASPMPWGKLEHPHNRSQVGGEQAEKHAVEAEAPQGAHWEDSDDSLSWSEEEDEEGVEGAASK